MSISERKRNLKLNPSTYPKFCTLSFVKKLTNAQQTAITQNIIKNYGPNLQITSTKSGSISPSNYDDLIVAYKADAKATKYHHDRVIAVMWLYINYLNDLPNKCRKHVCKPKLSKSQRDICIDIVKSNIALLERQQTPNHEEINYFKKLLHKLCDKK